ncbi:glycosyltransferase family 2 protein [Thalassoglobus sp.]|uniref:glycosyltransferase family 2 protein n=1 Tax=Thalassoglobus sp. TaxID=2795869 RepID=UPI003AA9D91D
MTPEISIIVPQFEKADLTIRCVESLLKHHPAPMQVIVVDDGSSKSALRLIQQRQFPNTEIVRNSVNRGITYSWNRGAELANGKFLIFLNNDVETNGDWCERLTAPIRKSECLIAGPKLRVESRFPHHLVSTSPRKELLEGWCLALSKSNFYRLGQFDERYRLYFSDTDLQLRILQSFDNRERTSQQVQRGVQEVPDLPVEHLGHRTTRSQPARSGQWRRDRKTYLQQWFPKAD